MIVYRDRTFCTQSECEMFDDCLIAANDKVREQARESGLPISLTKYKGCFEPKEEKKNEIRE
jgi:hypothetical protein